MRKKKIAVIGLKGLPAFGGAAAVGENIIEQLKAQYDFTVYSVASHTKIKTGYHNGYKHIVFNHIPFKNLNILCYYFYAAIHCLLFENYNIIHIHHHSVALIVLWLKIKYKVVLTTHGFHNILPKVRRIGWFFNCQLYFLKLCDVVTSVSNVEKAILLKKYNLAAEHIPNGINKVADIPDFKLIDEEYILFASGRIIPSKGCDIFLKALREINFNRKVIIAGNIEKDSYKKKLEHLSCDLNVEYLGLIRDKQKLFYYIRRCELFILPSTQEAMSMMLLEVVSQKIPVICSDIIENRLLFTDTEVLFFKTNNYIDLSVKINWALNNKPEMEKKAALAYTKVISEYNWKTIAQKYNDIYKSLL